MAKTKNTKRSRSSKQQQKRDASQNFSPELAQPLYEQATDLLQTGQPDHALITAQKSLKCLSSPSVDAIAKLPVLELIGEIYVELGDAEKARGAFLQAVEIDSEGTIPEETGGGADKFLWLAQLNEEGGAESIKWFDKGAEALRREIQELENAIDTEEAEDLAILNMKKEKLANALCGAAEVYMTDLSWEDDAESRCERLVTEACMVAPDSPEPLQTLASVRISQTNLEDARNALQRSLDMWTELPEEDNRVPDFPTRISLSRLLMEAELEDKALDVLHRLVVEDDSSVEAWYLGGWCSHLLAEKIKGGSDTSTEESRKQHLKNSLIWLRKCLRLYQMVDYEDDRMKDHAEELVEVLVRTLGSVAPAEGQEEEDDWEDVEVEGDEDVDEEMNGT